LGASKSDSAAKTKEAILESYNLKGVNMIDLSLFSSLTFLNVGDNNLRLEDFCSAPSLKELHLQCNGIQKIGELSGFRELIILNLSYNRLSASEITKLAKLPKLMHLDLVCNELTKVTGFGSFLNIQVLNLEKNKLHNTCFVELANLPKYQLCL
jgi:Leucine-rich repeat (LRR) protein